MKYFLDTNIIIYALKGMYPKIKNHFKEIPSMSIAIPEIVIAELEYGARKSNNYEKNKDRYEMFTSAFEYIPFCGRRVREEYGRIRSKLEQEGNKIGHNDLLIAAIVLSYDGILVTHNTKEFKRIEGLRVEDWTE